MRCSEGVSTLTAQFNMTTGASAITATGATWSAASTAMESLANGWWRCTVYGTTSNAAASAYAQCYILNSSNATNFLGNGTNGITLWGHQIEVGNFVSSYIPTTTAAATRAMDSVSLTGSALSAYKSANGTLVAKAVAVTTSSAVQPAIVGSEDFLIIGTFNTDNKIHLISGSDNVGNGTSLRPAADKIGYSWDSGNNFSIILNGGTVRTGTDNIAHNTTQYLGGNSANAYSQLWGYMSRATFWNSRLSDAQLQQLTAP